MTLAISGSTVGFIPETRAFSFKRSLTGWMVLASPEWPPARVLLSGSVYIFKDKNDRTDIEMYKKLADLVMRIDHEIYPDCLSRAKRKDKYYWNPDDALDSGKEHVRLCQSSVEKIETYLKELEDSGVDTSAYRVLKGSNKRGKEVERQWKDFYTQAEKYTSFPKDGFSYVALLTCFEDYCREDQKYLFLVEKGDIFMWVSGKAHAMTESELLNVAETPEEKELASKVPIGFGRHFEAEYWFEDLAEPELPSWRDKL